MIEKLKAEEKQYAERKLVHILFPKYWRYTAIGTLIGLVFYGAFLYWFVYILIKDQANIDVIYATQSGFKYWMVSRANLFIYLLSNGPTFFIILGLIIMGMPIFSVTYYRMKLAKLKFKIKTLELTEAYNKQKQLAEDLKTLREFRGWKNA